MSNALATTQTVMLHNAEQAEGGLLFWGNNGCLHTDIDTKQKQTTISRLLAYWSKLVDKIGAMN